MLGGHLPGQIDDPRQQDRQRPVVRVAPRVGLDGDVARDRDATGDPGLVFGELARLHQGPEHRLGRRRQERARDLDAGDLGEDVRPAADPAVGILGAAPWPRGRRRRARVA